MTDTSNTLGKEEANSKKTNVLNMIQGVTSLYNFLKEIQKTYLQDEEYLDIIGWLIEDPANFVKLLNNYDDLKKKCDDLERKLSQAATRLGEKDTGATAATGRNHYELLQEYKKLKGDFESVSTQVYEFLDQSDQYVGFDRSQKIAEIQSNLSKIILVNKFFPQPNAFKNSYFDTLSEQISNLILRSSQIAELNHPNSKKILQENATEINELVKNRLEQVLINGLAIFTKVSDSKVNLPVINKEVETWITQELKLNINAHPNLRANLNTLAEEGLSFVMRLTNATPAGRLWIEEKNTPFDPNKHQLHPTCDKRRIEFTIFPGYFIDSFVFHQALVFTK